MRPGGAAIAHLLMTMCAVLWAGVWQPAAATSEDTLIAAGKLKPRK